MRLRLAAACVAAVGLASLAAAAVSAVEPVCSSNRPLGLALDATHGAGVGVVRWRTATPLLPLTAGFRVWRDGAVVGQTRGSSLPVRVSPGRTFRIVVAPILRTGSQAGCTASIAVHVPGRRGTTVPAAAVVPCSAGTPFAPSFRREPAAPAGTFRWRVRGAAPAGFRVWRDRQVVGQTTGRSLRVRVSPGRPVKLTVRPVTRDGRVERCGATLAVTVAFQAPVSPGWLLAFPLTNTQVRLLWAPAAGRDGRFAGYRVVRDGLTLFQTRTNQAVVRVAPGRAYVFSVVAVDGQGHTSDPTDPVRLRTGYDGPGSPGGLALAALHGSKATLRWRAGAKGDGPIAGYRVFRDGVPVLQTKDTSVVAQVGSGGSSSFTVVTVDTRGYASAPSDPVTVTVRTAYALPGPPVGLQASDVTLTSATLSWSEGQSGSAPLAGFRVLRDGATIGQTKGQSLVVRLQPASSFTFTVVAVDSHGRTSAPSAPLVVETGFRPPTVPSGLSFSPVTSWSVTLRWQPSQPGDGRIGGYRVSRDGNPLLQTGHTSVVVNVVAGRAAVFTVAAVDTRGYASAESAPLTVQTAWRPPGPPTGLAASGVTDTAATLSWSAGTPGDGRIVGYRVLRGTDLVTQTSGLSAPLTLVPGKSYTVTVVSVDSRGQTSPAGVPLVINAPYNAPSAPSGLASANVTDHDLDLSWSASTAGSGKIAGYRVYRDGAILGQTSGTSLHVGNLRAGRHYAFTVLAADGLGQLSQPSPQLDVTTQRPPQSWGRAHAFVLSTVDQSFRDLQSTYLQIGTIYPTYFNCDTHGGIVGQDDPLVTNWAYDRGVAVMPRFNCQQQAVLHEILTNPPITQSVVDSLASIAAAQTYAGVNLDLESGAATDRDALTAFVQAVAARLHAIGKRVTVEVSAKYAETFTGRSGFYDYKALGAAADNVFVMAWGLHWSTSGPGSIDSLWWVTKVAQYTASIPTHSRFVLGLPLYGMDWPAGGGPLHPAAALEYQSIQALIQSTGAKPAVDAATSSPHFSYVDGGGVQHDVWYVNSASLSTRVTVAHQAGLGVGFWRLGNEDGNLWSNALLQQGVVWP